MSLHDTILDGAKKMVTDRGLRRTAEYVGVSLGMLRSLLDGRDILIGNVNKFINAFQIRIEVTSGFDSGSDALVTHDKCSFDSIMIPLLSVTASMGTGISAAYEKVIKHLSVEKIGLEKT